MPMIIPPILMPMLVPAKMPVCIKIIPAAKRAVGNRGRHERDDDHNIDFISLRYFDYQGCEGVGA